MSEIANWISNAHAYLLLQQMDAQENGTLHQVPMLQKLICEYDKIQGLVEELEKSADIPIAIPVRSIEDSSP